jgi:hypothetical protein
MGYIPFLAMTGASTIGAAKMPQTHEHLLYMPLDDEHVGLVASPAMIKWQAIKRVDVILTAQVIATEHSM